MLYVSNQIRAKITWDDWMISTFNSLVIQIHTENDKDTVKHENYPTNIVFKDWK